MPPILRLPAFVAAVLVYARVPSAGAAGDATERAMGAFEVMADLTLIDGTCRNVLVNFGVGFRYVRSRGLTDATLLPGGARRAEFERVLRSRQATFGPDELCGQVAKNYMEALPSSVLPIYRHAEVRP